MTKRTRIAGYRGGLTLWIILALLAAPFSPTASFLEAPCPEHEACPLRGRWFKKGVARAQGLWGCLIQGLKAFLILLILAWLLANALSFKDLLRGVPFSPPPCSDAASSTAPSQPSNTPRTTPDWEHPFLKTIHQDPTVQRYRPLFDLVDELAPPPNPHKRGPKKGKNADLVYRSAELTAKPQSLSGQGEGNEALLHPPSTVPDRTSCLGGLYGLCLERIYPPIWL